MNDSQASRCAWSELKSCSNPSYDDLRVYMAQRRTGVAVMAALPSGYQAEEERARPARAGDDACYFGERAMALPPVEYAIIKHDHLVCQPMPFAQPPTAPLHPPAW